LKLSEPVEAIIEESIDYYAPLMGWEPVKELFWQPSINLGTIRSGTVINAVPDSAPVRLGFRLAPAVHTTDIIGEIRDCAESCDGVTVSGVSWSIGTHLDPDDPIVRATRDIAEQVTDERLYRRSATGGGDPKTLRNAGIPAVEFAVGPDTVHADKSSRLSRPSRRTHKYTLNSPPSMGRDRGLAGAQTD